MGGSWRAVCADRSGRPMGSAHCTLLLFSTSTVACGARPTSSAHGHPPTAAATKATPPPSRDITPHRWCFALPLWGSFGLTDGHEAQNVVVEPHDLVRCGGARTKRVRSRTRRPRATPTPALLPLPTAWRTTGGRDARSIRWPGAKRKAARGSHIVAGKHISPWPARPRTACGVDGGDDGGVCAC